MAISFPAHIERHFLPRQLYNKMDAVFKNWESLTVEKKAFGQKSRMNFVVSKSNLAVCRDSVGDAPVELYEYLSAVDFHASIARTLASVQSKLDEEALLRAIGRADLEINVAVATGGYHNPIHADTKQRLLHGLIYFDVKSFSGGELNLYLPTCRCTKEMDQIPEITAVRLQEVVKPEDNLGVVIASTPASYHAASLTYGKRKFVYWALNLRDENIWDKNDSYDKPISFSEGRVKQQAPRLYKLIKGFAPKASYRYLERMINE